MKKTMIALATVLTVGVLGYHVANAGPGRWGGDWGPGPGYCNGAYDDDSASAPRQQWQTFRKDTADLRKQLTEKRHEYFTLVNGDKVDKNAAQALWSDMFDLRQQIRTKAEAAGIDPAEQFGRHRGRGWGQRGYGCNGPRGGGYFCDGPCGGGMGPGYGPGSCWNR